MLQQQPIISCHFAFFPMHAQRSQRTGPLQVLMQSTQLSCQQRYETWYACYTEDAGIATCHFIPSSFGFSIHIDILSAIMKINRSGFAK